MNELKIFTYNSNQVRTVDKNNETWWVLKDVCDILEASNSRMVADRLDTDEVSQAYITDSLGRKQETTIINESGLYNVILRSDKPNAKPFRKWVTSEVLPNIRKHGMYAKNELLDNPDLLIEVATALKQERQQRRLLEDQVAQDAPKVLFANSVAASKSSMLIGELAKIIKQNGVEMGEKRLFRWLRENGYLIKRRGCDFNAPTQRAMERGLFEVKETAVTHSDGHITINRTTKVTGKGQQYFINKFLGSENTA